MHLERPRWILFAVENNPARHGRMDLYGWFMRFYDEHVGSLADMELCAKSVRGAQLHSASFHVL